MALMFLMAVAIIRPCRMLWMVQLITSNKHLHSMVALYKIHRLVNICLATYLMVQPWVLQMFSRMASMRRFSHDLKGRISFSKMCIPT